MRAPPGVPAPVAAPGAPPVTEGGSLAPRERARRQGSGSAVSGRIRPSREPAGLAGRRHLAERSRRSLGSIVYRCITRSGLDSMSSAGRNPSGPARATKDSLTPTLSRREREEARHQRAKRKSPGRGARSLPRGRTLAPRERSPGADEPEGRNPSGEGVATVWLGGREFSTPIHWSRASCPTIERPPSRPREADYPVRGHSGQPLPSPPVILVT